MGRLFSFGQSAVVFACDCGAGDAARPCTSRVNGNLFHSAAWNGLFRLSIGRRLGSGSSQQQALSAADDTTAAYQRRGHGRKYRPTVGSASRRRGVDLSSAVASIYGRWVRRYRRSPACFGLVIRSLMHHRLVSHHPHLGRVLLFFLYLSFTQLLSFHEAVSRC